MSKPKPSPNRRAAKALIISLGLGMSFMMVFKVGLPAAGMIDCHRRGFEVRWKGLSPTCFMDFSKGMPKPRW